MSQWFIYEPGMPGCERPCGLPWINPIGAIQACLKVRWQDLFLYGSQASNHYQEGDCSLVLPSDTVVATKDTVTLSGSTWNIVSVGRLGGAVVAHGRPA